MHIYRYENEKELEVLHQVCSPVERHESVSQEIIDEMFRIMHKHRGIGLAAPQVGISQRFFIVEVEPGEPYVFINPEIIATSHEMSIKDEGCLSIPGVYTPVQRYERITMQAENMERKIFKLEASGLLAICLQHEFDHLNGVLHIERTTNSAMRDQMMTKYLRKYQLKEKKR
ncbi:peptide deformylase [Entomospira entomophila]|uniref:Peptide deformylase n=1 Tax=Entomospira entomophila TaxID=2719988 RepID=A0A968G8U8_9SPIO|nr:peptide deformylase [Entomospira entomophilus]NIZ39955.1 peptide deformylase [Entomospira entomophilus]WDI35516.1 peptide deformylase [Entomospira entomophilus]